jgi:hypothetical protein
LLTRGAKKFNYGRRIPNSLREGAFYPDQPIPAFARFRKGLAAFADLAVFSVS